MLRGRRAAIAGAFAIAAVAAVTAGCGGGGSALAFDPVAAAATKSQHAGAAHIRFALAVDGLQGRSVKVSGVGAIDGTSGELTMTPSTAPNSSVKEVFLKEGGDFVIYLRAGFLAARIPDGKHWAKLDLSTLGKSAGVDLGQVLSGSQLQPTDLLSMLKTEGAEVRKVGPAEIDGAKTTHYHVTVDTAKARKARGLESPTISVIAAAIPSIPEDVWIGKDGLVRRIRVALGLERSGRPVRMAIAMDLFDYGANVTIAAPPSSDVFDATQFAQHGLGSSFNY
jgi:hypothetical protein